MRLVLSTSRFQLLPITPGDHRFIFEGLSHPAVIPFYGVSYSSMEAAEEQMQFYQSLLNTGTGCWWKINDKGTAQPVGAIGFNNYNAQHKKAEIGFWLLPGSWKKGIINEVLPVVVHHLFSTVGVHRIEAIVEEGNDASSRTLENAGFTYEGTHRECEIKNGRFISLRMYSLLSTDSSFNGA